MTSWTTATASERGEMHERQGIPNEDHVRVSDDGTVVSVADGHGAPSYTRAERGSRLATAAAVELLQPVPTDLTELPDRLVRRWRELVAEDVDADPPPVDELRGGEPHRLYGTTLLATAVSSWGLVLVQLGDGDILLGRQDRSGAEQPIPPTPYARSNATDSLVQDDAAERVRIAVVEDLPAFVLLATDGLEASTTGDDWSDLVVTDLHEALAGRDPATLDRLLADRCRRAATEGGDDTTMALLAADALLGGT